MTAIYGHRGARGLFPENTLEGIKAVLKLPIKGIELDVVVSKEHHLLVSHNPFAHAAFCLDKNGKEISPNDNLNNFHLLNYDEIKLFDVGIKTHPNFPLQQKINTNIPLLAEAFTLLNATIQPDFTLFLEIKCDSSAYYPQTKQYVDLLLHFLSNHPFKGQLIIKSFDVSFMNSFHSKAKGNYQLGLLVENKNSVDDNLGLLTFKPDYYNPAYNLVNNKLVDKLHQQAIKIVTWTVNEPTDYKKMIQFGVDGVITDYPNKMT